MLQKSLSVVVLNRLARTFRPLLFVYLVLASLLAFAFLLEPLRHTLRIADLSVGFAVYALVLLLFAVLVSLALLRAEAIITREQTSKVVDAAVAAAVQHERTAAAGNLLHTWGTTPHF